ncbi:MAG: DUF4912 domain-containing protein [Nitrospirae bacterium]|nr:DUF4912 domain-containing protein [Nitrospirota bacterium]
MKVKAQKRTATIIKKENTKKKSVNKASEVIAGKKNPGAADKSARKKIVAASKSDKVTAGRKKTAEAKAAPKKKPVKAAPVSKTVKKALPKTAALKSKSPAGKTKVTVKPSAKVAAAAPVKKPAGTVSVIKKVKTAASVRKAVKKAVEKRPAPEKVVPKIKPVKKIGKKATKGPIAPKKTEMKAATAKPVTPKKRTGAKPVTKPAIKKESSGATNKATSVTGIQAASRKKTEPVKKDSSVSVKMAAPLKSVASGKPAAKSAAVKTAGKPQVISKESARKPVFVPASAAIVKSVKPAALRKAAGKATGSAGKLVSPAPKSRADAPPGKAPEVGLGAPSTPPVSAKAEKTSPTLKTPATELLSVAEMEEREGVRRPLKIFLPADDPAEDYQGGPEEPIPAGLPETYGENSFILMVVDPRVVYLDWEVIDPEVNSAKYRLAVRIYDVTGGDDTPAPGGSFLEIRLDRVTGRGYFESMMSGKEIIAEIGLVDAEGGFRVIRRSPRVSVPPILEFDELGVVRKLQEAGIRVGY